LAAARLYAELLGVPWTWLMAGEPPTSSGDKAGERGAEGTAVPQPAPPPLRPRVDIEVLSAILERVEANLARRRRKMSPLHKAELIANSYALVEEFGLEAATRELRSGLRVRSRSHAKSA